MNMLQGCVNQEVLLHVIVLTSRSQVWIRSATNNKQQASSVKSKNTLEKSQLKNSHTTCCIGLRDLILVASSLTVSSLYVHAFWAVGIV